MNVQWLLRTIEQFFSNDADVPEAIRIIFAERIDSVISSTTKSSPVHIQITCTHEGRAWTAALNVDYCEHQGEHFITRITGSYISTELPS